MDIILTLLIPFVLSIYSYPFINKIKFISNLPLAIKICFSIAVGISILVIFFSLWGMVVPFGFVLLSKLFFLVASTSSIYAFKIIYTNKIDVHRSVLKVIKEVREKDVLKFIILFGIIYLVLFLLRPVVDADVVDSYLTLARSINIADRIPSHNYFDNRPFIIPPVGGPVIFAFYYAISNNLASEVFKFINVPFFIGFLIMSYFLINKYQSKKISILCILMIMTIPFLEDFIFSAALYPDMIFSFLAICIFWLTDTVTSNHFNNLPNIKYILIGIFLSSMMLIKYQALFMYILIIAILLSAGLKSVWRLMILPLMFIPWFISIILQKVPFSAPSYFNMIVFVCILIGNTLYFLKKSKPVLRVKLIHVILVLTFSLLGIIGLIRNQFLYKGIEELNIERKFALTLESAIGVGIDGKNTLEGFAYLLSSAFSLVYLIPKLVGFYDAYSQVKLILPIFILTSWYSYWVLYLGSADYKWLLPVFPFLIIVLMRGLKKIFHKYDRMVSAVIVSLIFFLLSSKFIFWNIGVSNFGSTGFRQIVTDIAINKPDFSYHANTLYNLMPENIKYVLIHVLPIIQRTIFLLTSRNQIIKNDLLFYLFFSLSSFLIMVILVGLFKKLKLRLLIFLLILISYSYIYFTIPKGNPSVFAKYEREMLFDYWGQHTKIIPYLKTYAKPDDKIILFSVPSGLSYYTNLRTYNLEYGAGLALFYSIFKESDSAKIYDFYKRNNMRYILIRDYQESKERFAKLRGKTHIFDILNNRKYTREVIAPSETVYWRLYEVL